MATSKNKNNDREVLVKFCQGDQVAFNELVNKYKDGLYSFLRRFVNRTDIVEDIFQETFLQLYLSRESFDPNRPLRPWLFTIAANKARDALRKIQRTAATQLGPIADSGDVSIDDVLNSITSYETTPYDEIEKAEAGQIVRDIISGMPENLREILILAYFEQFSYKHMAEILSIPIGTVKSRLHTAVMNFSKQWRAADKSSRRGSV